jgi:hypothetical protein
MQELPILAFKLVTQMDKSNLKAHFNLSKAYLEASDLDNAMYDIYRTRSIGKYASAPIKSTKTTRRTKSRLNRTHQSRH